MIQKYEAIFRNPMEHRMALFMNPQYRRWAQAKEERLQLRRRILQANVTITDHYTMIGK